MPAEIDAVIARLKAQAAAQARQLPKKARAGSQSGAIPEAEQIRRFLAGDERHRLESGQITPTQWAQYQAAMVGRLRQLGALEEPHGQ